jgi:hypothetical protein
MLHLFAALLLLSSIPGLWEWDASEGATGYKFCWSYNAAYWNHGLCSDLGDVLSFDSAEFEAMWAVEANPGMELFYQVIAYDADGYDPTGQAFEPTPTQWVCP